MEILDTYLVLHNIPAAYYDEELHTLLRDQDVKKKNFLYSDPYCSLLILPVAAHLCASKYYSCSWRKSIYFQMYRKIQKYILGCLPQSAVFRVAFPLQVKIKKYCPSFSKISTFNQSQLPLSEHSSEKHIIAWTHGWLYEQTQSNILTLYIYAYFEWRYYQMYCILM